MFDRDRGDGRIAKAIEPLSGGYPDIAFAIFEETEDEIVRETIGPGKHVGPSVVNMQEAPVYGSDP